MYFNKNIIDSIILWDQYSCNINHKNIWDQLLEFVWVVDALWLHCVKLVLLYYLSRSSYLIRHSWCGCITRIESKDVTCFYVSISHKFKFVKNRTKIQVWCMFHTLCSFHMRGSPIADINLELQFSSQSSYC